MRTAITSVGAGSFCQLWRRADFLNRPEWRVQLETGGQLSSRGGGAVLATRIARITAIVVSGVVAEAANSAWLIGLDSRKESWRGDAVEETLRRDDLSDAALFPNSAAVWEI